jgi:hypothetical protein
VPLQAQVLLLTRFPYLTDAQRTEVLASTGLPSGTPQVSKAGVPPWAVSIVTVTARVKAP